MKKIPIVCIALVAANAAFADIYSSSINSAKNVAQQAPQSETQQAAAVQATQPPAVQPAPASPNPQLEATLQNISNLRTDLDNLGKLTPTNSPVPVKSSLLTNLFIAAQSVKPAEQTTTKLVDHLTDAIAGRDTMIQQHTKLAQDIHALFNSSHLTAEQQQTLLDEVQGILQTGGVTTDVALSIVGDLKAIAAETAAPPG